MGYNVGMPTLKLSATEGKGGRHSGNLAKVAKEALSERQGQDLDINHELTHTNQYLPCNINGEIKTVTSAEELLQYSDDWVAKRNKEVEANNKIVRPLIRELNRQRIKAGKDKLGDKAAVKSINEDRTKRGEPPLQLMAKIKSDAVLMCGAIIKPPKAFMDTLTREEQEQFLLDGFAKFKGIVGEDNVKAAVIHWDELVPHIHIFWQPVTSDGRLCAKETYDIKFFDRLNREMPQFLRKQGWDIDDCDAYDTEEAQKIREEQGEKAFREYKEKRRQERAEKKSGRGSIKFKSDMDKAAAEKEKEVTELQDKIEELTTQKSDVETAIETGEAKLGDINKQLAKAQAELVKQQQIPLPPKPPFERKPTPPFSVSREEYIRQNVPANLKRSERKKEEKIYGDNYDIYWERYLSEQKAWEQYERDTAEYDAKYGMAKIVKMVAEQQSKTAQEQAQTAVQQQARAKALQERQQQLDQTAKVLHRDRASIGTEVERRVQQALRKTEAYAEYGRTSERFNRLYSNLIGNGVTYDAAKEQRAQERTAPKKKKGFEGR